MFKRSSHASNAIEVTSNCAVSSELAGRKLTRDCVAAVCLQLCRLSVVSFRRLTFAIVAGALPADVDVVIVIVIFVNEMSRTRSPKQIHAIHFEQSLRSDVALKKTRNRA